MPIIGYVAYRNTSYSSHKICLEVYKMRYICHKVSFIEKHILFLTYFLYDPDFRSKEK